MTVSTTPTSYHRRSHCGQSRSQQVRLRKQAAVVRVLHLSLLSPGLWAQGGTPVPTSCRGPDRFGGAGSSFSLARPMGKGIAPLTRALQAPPTVLEGLERQNSYTKANRLDNFTTANMRTKGSITSKGLPACRAYHASFGEELCWGTTTARTNKEQVKDK